MKYSGIYKIENIVNHKIYIGQSKDIESRWEHHKWELNNHRHPNNYLQKAWDKYGEDTFIFEIVELCDESVIDVKEQEYIKLFQSLSYLNGYNLDSGGNLNKHHSQETKDKIRDKHLGKIISEETRKKISQNRKGKCCGKQHYNYGKSMPKELKERLTQSAKERNHGKAWQARKVICLNTNEIFDCILDAGEKYNLYPQNIAKCCQGQRRYCGRLLDNTPLQWAYYEENIKYELKENVDKYNGSQKPIVQYDKEMNYINTYESAREASRILNIGYRMISQVCKGQRKSTHGFIFKFKD